MRAEKIKQRIKLHVKLYFVSLAFSLIVIACHNLSEPKTEGFIDNIVDFIDFDPLKKYEGHRPFNPRDFVNN